MEGMIFGPVGYLGMLWMSSTGVPMVPRTGQWMRINGVDYMVHDVLWDYDLMKVMVYVR